VVIGFEGKYFFFEFLPSENILMSCLSEFYERI